MDVNPPPIEPPSIDIQPLERTLRFCAIGLCTVSGIGLLALIAAKAGRQFCQETWEGRRAVPVEEAPGKVATVAETAKDTSLPTISSAPGTTTKTRIGPSQFATAPAKRAHLNTGSTSSSHGARTAAQEPPPARAPQTKWQPKEPRQAHKSYTSTTRPSVARPQQQAPVAAALTDDDMYRIFVPINDQTMDAAYGIPHYEVEPMRSLIQRVARSELSSEQLYAIKDLFEDWMEEVMRFLPAEYKELQELARDPALSTQDRCDAIARIQLYQQEVTALKKLATAAQGIPQVLADMLSPLGQLQTDLSSIQPPASQDVQKLLKENLADTNTYPFPVLSRRLSPFLELLSTNDPLAAAAKRRLSASHKEWITDQEMEERLTSDLYPLSLELASCSDPTEALRLVTTIAKCEQEVQALVTKYEGGAAHFPSLERWLANDEEQVALRVGRVMQRLLLDLHHQVDDAIMHVDSEGTPDLSVVRHYASALQYISEKQLCSEKSPVSAGLASAGAAALSADCEWGLPLLSSHLDKLGVPPLTTPWYPTARELPPTSGPPRFTAKYESTGFGASARGTLLMSEPPRSRAMRSQVRRIKRELESLRGMSETSKRRWQILFAGIQLSATVLNAAAYASSRPPEKSTGLVVASEWAREKYLDAAQAVDDLRSESWWDWISHPLEATSELWKAIEARDHARTILSIETEGKALESYARALQEDAEGWMGISDGEEISFTDYLDSQIRAMQDTTSFAYGLTYDPDADPTDVSDTLHFLNVMSRRAVEDLYQVGGEFFEIAEGPKIVDAATVATAKTPQEVFAEVTALHRTVDSEDDRVAPAVSCVKALETLTNTHADYLSALASHERTEQLAFEAPKLEAVNHKIQTAVTLSTQIATSPTKDAAEALAGEISSLGSGESLFFTGAWKGKNNNKVATYQVTRQPGGEATLTLYLNAEEKSKLRVVSISGIQEKQLTSVPTIAYLQGLATPAEQADRLLAPEKVLAQVLEGEITETEIETNQLGPLRGPLAVLSDTYETAALTHRMTALTLVKSTKAYAQENAIVLQESTPEGDKHRKALSKGVESALAASRLAIAHQGFVDYDLQFSLSTLGKMQADLAAHGIQPPPEFVPIVNDHTDWKTELLQVADVRDGPAALATTPLLDNYLAAVPNGARPLPYVEPEEVDANDVAIGIPEKSKDLQLMRERQTALGAPRALRPSLMVSFFSTHPGQLLDLTSFSDLEPLLAENSLRAGLALDPGLGHSLSGLLHRASSLPNDDIKAYSAYLVSKARRMISDEDLLPEEDGIFSRMLSQPELETRRLAHYFRALSHCEEGELTLEAAEQLLTSVRFVEIHGMPEALASSEQFTIDPLHYAIKNTHAESLSAFQADPKHSAALTRALRLATVLPHSLPDLVTNDAVYQAIFTDEPDVLASSEDGLTVELDREVYQVQLPDEGPPIISRAFAGKWYQATPAAASSGLDMPFAPHPDDLLWLPQTQNQDTALPVFFQSGLTSVPMLRLTQSEGTWSAIVDSTPAHRLAEAGASLHARVDAIEHPDYQVILADDEGIIQLHLPRFGLTFSATESNGAMVLSSRELEGYALQSTDSEPAPILNAFPQHLMLTRQARGQSETAVLLPSSNKKPSNDGGWLGTAQDYLLYRVQGSMLHPIGDSSEQVFAGYVAVARTLSENKQYEAAAAHLRAAETALFVSPEEYRTSDLSGLKEIVDTGLDRNAGSENRSPQATAIRLLAASIVEKAQGLNKVSGKPLRLDIATDLDRYSPAEILPTLRVAPATISKLQRAFGAAQPPTLPPQSKVPTFLPSDQPTSPASTPQLMTDLSPILVESFPSAVLPLFRFLYAPNSLECREAEAVAIRYGIDLPIAQSALHRTLHHMLEFRYHHLLHYQSRGEQDWLTAELNMVGLLLSAARGELPKTGRFKQAVDTAGRFFQAVWNMDRSHLAAKERPPMDYSGLSPTDVLLHEERLQALQEGLSTEDKQLVSDIWQLWIHPQSMPLPLKPGIKSTVDRPTTAPRPVLHHPLTDLAVGDLSQPILTAEEASELFVVRNRSVPSPANPFEVDAQSPMVADGFALVNEPWKAYQGREIERYDLEDAFALAPIKESLAATVTSAGATFRSLEAQAIRLLNAVNNPTDASRRKAALLEGQERNVTLQDALTALARGPNTALLLELNPSLDEEAANLALEIAAQALLEKRTYQRATRAISAIEKVEYHPTQKGPDFDEAIQDVHGALNDHLRYDPAKNPLFLLAETEYNIGLWEAQVHAMEQLGPEGAVPKLIELSMGMGKTDVISPVLLSLLADGENLPILVLPEALVKSMAPRLQERIQQEADLNIQVIPIERGAWPPSQIRRLREELQEMAASRTPLVWSASDLQTLANSAIEAFYDESMHATAKGAERIGEWQELLSFLMNNGLTVGDEIHAIMDILTAFHLTLGASEQLSVDEMDAAAHFLTTATELPEGVSLDTPEGKALMATTLLRTGVLAEPEVHDVIGDLDANGKAHLQSYILGETGKKDAEAVINTVTEKASPHIRTRIANHLATYKESLSGVFQHTANAQLGKHYVLNAAGTEAVPADEGNPLPSALFGSSLERLYYSGNLFLQEGVSENVVEEDLAQLVLMRREELSRGEVDSKALSIFTERYGHSHPLTPKDFEQEDIEALTAIANSNPSSIIQLTRGHLFPKIEVYRKQIASSTHMYHVIANAKAAMSGTLYNLPTFKHLYGDTELSDTIPKVTSMLLAVAPHDHVQELHLGATPEETIDNLYGAIALNKGAVIDTTGRLAKTNMRAYAESMLERISADDPSIRGVVYYEGNTLMVTFEGARKPVLYSKDMDRDALCAIWDVPHTTGSDIPLGRTRDATLIVGKHIRLFHLAQSAMRMRKAGKGQRLEMVVPDDELPIIKKALNEHLGVEIADHTPLTIHQVVQYALLNELLQEAHSNFAAIDIRMKMALVNPVMKTLFDPAVKPTGALEAFSLVQGLFIETKSTNPWDEYGDVATDIPLAQAKQNLLSEWKNSPAVQTIREHPELFPTVDIDGVVAQWDAILESDLGPLYETIQMSRDLDSKQKTHTKTQVKQATRTKTVVKTIALTSEPPPSGELSTVYKPRPVVSAPVSVFAEDAFPMLSLDEARLRSYDEVDPGTTIRLDDMFTFDPDFQPVRGLLNEPKGSLSLSINLAPAFRASKPGTPYFNPYYPFQKFASHALIREDEAGDIRLVLLDTHDAVKALEQLAKDRRRPGQHPMRVALYNLADDRIVEGGTPLDLKNRPEAVSRIDTLVAKAKYMSGITSYTPAQQRVLKGWISEDEAEAFHHFFVDEVARHRPSALANLEKSDLWRVLKKKGCTGTAHASARPPAGMEVIEGDPAIRPLGIGYLANAHYSESALWTRESDLHASLATIIPSMRPLKQLIDTEATEDRQLKTALGSHELQILRTVTFLAMKGSADTSTRFYWWDQEPGGDRIASSFPRKLGQIMTEAYQHVDWEATLENLKSETNVDYLAITPLVSRLSYERVVARETFSDYLLETAKMVFRPGYSISEKGLVDFLDLLEEPLGSLKHEDVRVPLDADLVKMLAPLIRGDEKLTNSEVRAPFIRWLVRWSTPEQITALTDYINTYLDEDEVWTPLEFVMYKGSKASAELATLIYYIAEEWHGKPLIDHAQMARLVNNDYPSLPAQKVLNSGDLAKTCQLAARSGEAETFLYLAGLTKDAPMPAYTLNGLFNKAAKVLNYVDNSYDGIRHLATLVPDDPEEIRSGALAVVKAWDARWSGHRRHTIAPIRAAATGLPDAPSQALEYILDFLRDNTGKGHKGRVRFCEQVQKDKDEKWNEVPKARIGDTLDKAEAIASGWTKGKKLSQSQELGLTRLVEAITQTSDNMWAASEEWLKEQLATKDTLSPVASLLLYHQAYWNSSGFKEAWQPGTKLNYGVVPTTPASLLQGLVSLQKIPAYPDLPRSMGALKILSEIVGAENIVRIFDGEAANLEDLSSSWFKRAAYSFSPSDEDSLIDDPQDFAYLESMLQGVYDRSKQVSEPGMVRAWWNGMVHAPSPKEQAVQFAKNLARTTRRWISQEAPSSLMDLIDEIAPLSAEDAFPAQILQHMLDGLAGEVKGEEELSSFTDYTLNQKGKERYWDSIPEQKILDALDQADAITAPWEDLSYAPSTQQFYELPRLTKIMCIASPQVKATSMRWLQGKLATQDPLGFFASQLLMSALEDGTDELISHWRPGTHLAILDRPYMLDWGRDVPILQKLPIWPNAFRSENGLKLLRHAVTPVKFSRLLKNGLANIEGHLNWSASVWHLERSKDALVSDPDDLKLFEELLRGVQERADKISESEDSPAQAGEADEGADAKLSARDNARKLAGLIRKSIVPNAPWSLIELLDEMDPQPPENASAPQALQLSLAALAGETRAEARYGSY